jgi:hypothetical protein
LAKGLPSVPGDHGRFLETGKSRSTVVWPTINLKLGRRQPKPQRISESSKFTGLFPGGFYIEAMFGRDRENIS